MYHTTEAIILNKRESGEADSIIICYTKDFGKISLLARGLRKSESKLKNHLEPMTYCKITFVNSRRIILTDAETIDSFYAIKNDYGKMNAGIFILNLIIKSINGEEKDEKIFKLLLDFLKNIFLMKDLKLSVAEFELNLLNFLGYAPDNFFVELQKKENSESVFISVNNFFEKIIGEKLPKIIF